MIRKVETEQWRQLGSAVALSAINRDTSYECRCGEEPYTDGEQFPLCFAIASLDRFKQMRLKIERAGKPLHRSRRG